ncbi:quinone oxidoreductase [Saccharopolyspora sp. K220]|uniref:quinone oxidoreductase family protein n=1 Tax=Saccharopolyspora soli TaxID=2926618 RepID=UPI001F59285D|nr:quinone oxidoreductase [Saccharopolyspora soli]MCI2424096.1 quinone oxidoreductase [Saccharopolyspora soli]
MVDVVVAGVNFMDTGTRWGFTKAMHTLPMSPGVEGAGRVSAVGDGVTDVKVGDRVAWSFAWGSYAQQVIVPAAQLVPVPDDIDFETAASVMLQGLTALSLVRDSHRLEAGQTALIHAAAGGVGLLLTQIIKILGGQALGRVSREEKFTVVKSAGADVVIVAPASKFGDEVLNATDGRGVDVVYDGTGGEGFFDSIRSLNHYGAMVMFGLPAGPPPEINVFTLPRNIRITAPSVLQSALEGDRLARYSAQLFDWLRTGRLAVHVGRRYPLSDAAKAHIDIESRRTTGKLLLIP